MDQIVGFRPSARQKGRPEDGGAKNEYGAAFVSGMFLWEKLFGLVMVPSFLDIRFKAFFFGCYIGLTI